MAVSVDTVYQKVLALINKEQRGYLTPQDFNLLADKAQMEIFESYFHSIKNNYHGLKNNINYADNIEMDLENLHPFENIQVIPVQTSGELTLPSLYRLKSLQRVQSDGSTTEVDEVEEKEFLNIISNPLLSPTIKRSIYTRTVSTLGGTMLQIRPLPTAVTNFVVKFWQRPIKPNWAYVIINEKALFNGNLAQNFLLNASEEENLVTKILELAGVIIQKPGLVEVAMSQEARTKQQND